MQPAEFCRDIAAPPGSNFHYATLFQPPAGRRTLNALFALLAEIDSTLRNVHDPAVGRLRMLWWMEEIVRLPAGVTAHPVGLEIGQLLQADAGLAAELREFVAAAAGLTDAAPPETGAEWIERFTPVHGRLWAVAAHCLAGREHAGSEYAARIGALLAALEDLQQLPLSLRSGRCPLPAQELAKHGLSATNLAPDAADGKASAYLGQTIGWIRSGLLAAGNELSRQGGKALLFAGIMAQLGAALCLELEEDAALILRHRTSLTPIRKLWIACRTRINWSRSGR